jgi:hypothetical protein
MSERLGSGWDVPAEVRDHVVFHWFHIGPGTRRKFCVLSRAPVWYVGHFDHGRMRQCVGAACEHCAHGTGKQIRYVVSVVDLESRQLGVVEISASLADDIKVAAERNGGLRGLLMSMGKASKAKQSRTEVQFMGDVPPEWTFDLEPLNLREVLEKTWDRLG